MHVCYKDRQLYAGGRLGGGKHCGFKALGASKMVHTIDFILYAILICLLFYVIII